MTFDMLFSTFGSRIIELVKNLPKVNDNVAIIICHQTNVELPLEIKEILDLRKDIKYFSLDSKGVTKSRNFAISKSNADIILFCDDDVTYPENLYNIVCQAYMKNKDQDFITFSYIKTGLGLHKFGSERYSHNLKSILNVGTIEVTCRRDKLDLVDKWFPEDMGAGSQYYLCDEPVFLSRLLKSGLVGCYEPVVIGEHPPESSGIEFVDINSLISRLYCFVRIFGSLAGRTIYSLFIIKNYSRFKNSTLFYKSLTVVFKKVDRE